LSNSCWDGGSRGVGSSSLNHGVQTGTGESRGTDEVLGCGEKGLEIRLNADGISVALGSTVVEALVDSLRGCESCREGKETRRTHVGRSSGAQR